MDIKGSIDLMTMYLKYILPLSFIVNVTILLVNMFINAVFKGKVVVTQ